VEELRSGIAYQSFSEGGRNLGVEEWRSGGMEELRSGSAHRSFSKGGRSGHCPP